MGKALSLMPTTTRKKLGLQTGLFLFHLNVTDLEGPETIQWALETFEQGSKVSNCGAFTVSFVLDGLRGLKYRRTRDKRNY
jgi:hypothetical protein